MNDKIDPDVRDDELLSALLDGELDEQAADVLTERLAREPALARRLEALRSANADVRAMYASIDQLPMPQGVLDLLATNGSGDAARPDNVVAFPRRLMERFANAPVAIAASVAVAAGFFANQLLQQAPQPASELSALQARTVPAGSAVYELLEHNPSARDIAFGDGARGEVVLTFQDERGDWCRQLRIASDTTELQALACRRDGNWRNEVLSFGEPAASEYQQASAAASAVISSAIDRFIGDREPLGPAEEEQRIRDGWRKKP